MTRAILVDEIKEPGATNGYDPIYGFAKLECQADGNGESTISNERGFSSFTDNGVGEYSLGISTALSTQHEPVGGQSLRTASAAYTGISYQTFTSTTALELNVYDGSFEDSEVTVIVWGDLA